MSVCQGCKAEIVWALTSAGKSMPLDPEPHPDGNVEAMQDQDGRWHVIAVHPGPDLFGGTRYHSHFTTCPKADDFKRKKR